MAEHCVVPGGQDRRHPAAFMAESLMANGVNTTMNRVEATGLCALRDSAARQPDGRQLGGRDHTVLVGGEPCDRNVPT
jgi:hypothetical protein